MIAREIEAKSILSKSAIQDWALNAYVGCQHDCRYCCARFMKRFTGHQEAWGSFVDVELNAPVAPLLPGAKGLADLLQGKVDRGRPAPSRQRLQVAVRQLVRCACTFRRSASRWQRLYF